MSKQKKPERKKKKNLHVNQVLATENVEIKGKTFVLEYVNVSYRNRFIRIHSAIKCEDIIYTLETNQIDEISVHFCAFGEERHFNFEPEQQLYFPNIKNCLKETLKNLVIKHLEKLCSSIERAFNSISAITDIPEINRKKGHIF